MTDEDAVDRSSTTFARLLSVAAQLPGVRIDRNSYLRTALKRYCSPEQIERAIAVGPAAAGVPIDVITRIANTSIRYETSKVTGISALAGIPGGLAVAGTVPADMAQFVGHMLRIAQKLAYAYGWPNLFVDDGDDLDEATEGILTLFLGVMMGAQAAQTGVTKVASMMAAQALKKLPQQALTKGVIYPIVKKVAALLGVAMTKKLFASGVAKAIPIVGAILSGGLTLGTFAPMSKKLQRHLATLEITKPGHRQSTEGEAAPATAPPS